MWEPSNLITLISVLAAALTAILAALVPVWLDNRKSLREREERSADSKSARRTDVQQAAILLIQSIAHFRHTDQAEIHYSAGKRAATEAASELAQRFAHWEFLIHPLLSTDQLQEVNIIGDKVNNSSGAYIAESKVENHLSHVAPQIMDDIRRITNEAIA